MSNVGNTRKLFLDSRFKISGSDSDFTLELPQDVQCTRTSSFFVASCSFANTYGTITDFNNKIYFFAIHPPPNLGPPFRLYVRTIPKGVYTPTTFAPALQTALNQDTRSPCTVTWNDGSSNYQIEFAKGSDLLSWVIPSFDTVDALVAYAGIQLTIDGDYSRGPKYYSVNTLLNMPTTPISLVGAQSITTGVVDLSPIREIYLHSSLANNRTPGSPSKCTTVRSCRTATLGPRTLFRAATRTSGRFRFSCEILRGTCCPPAVSSSSSWPSWTPTRTM